MRWEEVTLGSIAKISTGKYDANHNDEHGKYLFYTCAIKPFKANTFSFNAPAILLPGNGANVGEVLFQLEGQFEAYQRTYVVNELKNVDPIFLKFCFTKNWKRHLNGKQYGSATNYIRYNNLSEFQIPIPPLPIQKKIAEILDIVDALRRTIQEQLKELDDLEQAVFWDMFGEETKKEKLNNLCKKITDGTHQSPKFVSSGIPFLLVSNIVNNQITYKTHKFITEEEYKVLYKRTPVEIGDLLITTVGSYGNPAIVKDDRKFMFQRHIGYLKPDHELINYVYLFGALQSLTVKRQIERLVRGVAQKTLNLKELKSIEIPIPDRELQNQFAKIIQNIELQKQELKTSLKESEDLFNGLIQEIFN